MQRRVWMGCAVGAVLSMTAGASVVPETSMAIPGMVVKDSSAPTPQVVGHGHYGEKTVVVLLTDSALGTRIPVIVQADRLAAYARLWYSNMDCTGTPVYIDAPESAGPPPTIVEALQGVTYSVDSVNQVWRSTGSTSLQTLARVYVPTNASGQRCFAWSGGAVNVRSVVFVDDLDNHFTPPYVIE